MNAQLIPAARYTVDREDVSVDRLCFEYLLSVLRDRRQAGKVKGYVEAVYAANPGLADIGLILPRGRVVILPEHAVEVASAGQTRRLWD